MLLKLKFGNLWAYPVAEYKMKRTKEKVVRIFFIV